MATFSSLRACRTFKTVVKWTFFMSPSCTSTTSDLLKSTTMACHGPPLKDLHQHHHMLHLYQQYQWHHMLHLIPALPVVAPHAAPIPAVPVPPHGPPARPTAGPVPRPPGLSHRQAYLLRHGKKKPRGGQHKDWFSRWYYRPPDP